MKSKREQLVELKDYLIQQLKDDRIVAYNPMKTVKKGTVVLISSINGKKIEFEKHQSNTHGKFDYRTFSILVNGRYLYGDIYGKAVDELKKELGPANFAAINYLHEMAAYSPDADVSKDKLEDHYLDKTEGYDINFMQCALPAEAMEDLAARRGKTSTEMLKEAYAKYLTKPRTVEHYEFDVWKEKYIASRSNFPPNERSLKGSNRELTRRADLNEMRLKNEQKEIRYSQIKRERVAYWQVVKVVKATARKPAKVTDTIISPKVTKQPQSHIRLTYIYNKKEDVLQRLPLDEAEKLIAGNKEYKFVSKSFGKEFIRKKQHVRVGPALQPFTDLEGMKYGNRQMRRAMLQKKSSTCKGKHAQVNTISAPKVEEVPVTVSVPVQEVTYKPYEAWKKTDKGEWVKVQKFRKVTVWKSKNVVTLNDFVWDEENEVWVDTGKPTLGKTIVRGSAKTHKNNVLPNYSHTTRTKKKVTEPKKNPFETFAVREYKAAAFEKPINIYSRVYSYPVSTSEKKKKTWICPVGTGDKKKKSTNDSFTVNKRKDNVKEKHTYVPKGSRLKNKQKWYDKFISKKNDILSKQKETTV